MGQTIIEKILAGHAGRESVRPGDIVEVKVDTSVLIDVQFLKMWWVEPTKIADPDSIAIIFDHLVPAKDQQATQAHEIGRRFASKWGIKRFHDVGPDQGICHQVIADRAYAVPGEILLCEDSHTCSGGAFNCAARGVGPPEMIYTICTGETWFKVGETVRYELSGELRPPVSAKDIFLYLAGRFGSHATQNIEYGGPAMPSLSLDFRRTMSTMSAELSAEFAVWDPDDILLRYVEERLDRSFTPVYADPDATYLDVRSINLSEIEPQVGLPDSLVRNTVPVSELGESVRLDQCFIGSCANGTINDLATAAEIVAGKKVAPNTRFIVTPGSQAIYRQALRLGYIETLSEAGAIVTSSACGACAGLDMGVLGRGETCLTSSTRNFKGRMGSPEARIYMASPATVAASAIAGEIVDPRAVAGAAGG